MTMKMGFLALATLVAGVVWLNAYARRRRARLTPDERRQEDEEAGDQLRIW